MVTDRTRRLRAGVIGQIKSDLPRESGGGRGGGWEGECVYGIGMVRRPKRDEYGLRMMGR